MKKKINLSALLANLLLAVLVAAFAAPLVMPGQYSDAPLFSTAVIAAPLFFAGFFITVPKGSLVMAIQTEVWANDIQEAIYPDNSFFMNAQDDSEFIENKKVHLPEAGTAPGSEKNRTSLPATVNQIDDAEYSYDIDSYTTDPILLKNSDEIEVSYPKRQSILQSHTDVLRTRMADELAIKWAPSLATNFARTTGTGRAAYVSGQTGNRKALVKDDIIEVHRLMNAMDIPLDGRMGLIDANLYADLLKIEEFVSLEKIGSAALVKGAVGMLLGFQIFVRSRAIRYTNDGTPAIKAYGASVAAADNLAALFWHKNFVRVAKGNVEIFQEEKSPTFYGDIFSAEVRFGGKKARNDEKGVVSLIEAAA